ncbi:hypothetical protein [Clostridium sporogenes]|uniref:hypothetical protein n=1 Tax=Clostridium sporogenes TaxID=1509 RepID=UPI0006B28AD7|nr:hypothetical protein [Clostridium sporogenes]KOY65388.1 hypothetical protein AN649_12975 [Clostridium sporogenes]MDS1006684.1 hypothetical protein [Clostridium sporogenes]
MLNVEQTIKNLIGIEVTEDFKNDVICAFDTTSQEVIVSKQYGRYEDYQCYENMEDSPIICIKIEDSKIVDAWE